MRRGVEHIIKDLMPHLMSHNQMGVPFKKEDKNVPD
jgi:hypothetical protein